MSASLAERVAQLERELRELRAAAVQPSYSPLAGLTIAPDGSIAYDFDGHVHAGGLDLDAGEGDAPPDDRKVRWTRTSDGALVGEVYAVTHAGGLNDIDVIAHPGDSGESSAILAAGGEPGAADVAFVRAMVSAFPGQEGPQVVVRAGALFRLVFREDGDSDFAQLDASSSTRQLAFAWSAGGDLEVYVDGSLVGSLAFNP